MPWAQRNVRRVSGPPTNSVSVVGPVDAALSRFLDERGHAVLALGSELEPVVAEARAFVLSGGKRLRPTFAYWGWRSADPETTDDRAAAMITAAASLELLHACALVHDDLMDASETRRGRPSVHETFAALHRRSGWPGDPVVFGSSAAILLGDLLLSWSDAMFASAGLDRAAGLEYESIRETVTAGQYLDMLVQARGRFSAEDAVRVAAAKTTKYTVLGPLLLGATAGGAEPAVRAALETYGHAVGEAFQLRDDILGVFGDPDETGKPAGDDLREGKHTLLVAWAVEGSDAGPAELVRARLGDRDMDDATVTDLRAAITDSGALDRVEQRIADRTDEARAVVRSAPMPSAAIAALDALALAAAQRRT